MLIGIRGEGTTETLGTMSDAPDRAEADTSVLSASGYITERVAVEPGRISLSRLADTSGDGVVTKPAKVQSDTDNDVSPSADTSA
jgi:hypothetical protein